MTHPLVYAGSATIGSGVLALGLLQSPVSDRAGEIAAIGDIVESLAIIVAPILASWLLYKSQQAKAASDAAKAAAEAVVVIAKANLDKTTEVDKKVDDRWTKVDERLDAADALNRTYAAFIAQLTAEKAAAVQAAAVADVEKAAAIEAGRVKELADLRAVQPMPAASAPAAPVPAAPVGTIAAVTDAVHTLSDAMPKLDSIQDTGEATNTIVTKIDQKP